MEHRLMYFSLKISLGAKMTIADYDNVYTLWMSCVGMGLNNLDDSKEGNVVGR